MSQEDVFHNFDPLKEIDERKAELARKHELLRKSKEFQDQRKYLLRITQDFLKATQISWFTATRSDTFVDNSLVFRSIDDLNQSVIAIRTLIEQGMLIPARREMRYILESSVKNLYVDQKAPSKTFEEKIMFLHEQVPRSSISIVDDLDLPFSNENKTAFIVDVKSMYATACAYIHPSKTQIDERIRLAVVEAYVGFERPRDLERMNKELFRLYEAALVLVFTSLGASFLGDVFIQWLDDDLNWRYHKGKYIKSLSSNYDYKAERKERKTASKSLD
jgi:hypothetical protein